MSAYKEAILIINIVSLLFLLGLSGLLFHTRRYNKRILLPAIIFIASCTPIYIYNIVLTFNLYDISLWLAPLAYSSITLLFPALWLYIHNYLNTGNKFSKLRLIHFIPTITCAIVYLLYLSTLPFHEQANFMLHKNTHMNTWISYTNIIILILQIIMYFPIIFIYLSQVKKLIFEYFSYTEWLNYRWFKNTAIFLALTFATIVISYHLCKNSSTWVLNIFEILIACYFTYNVIKTTPEDIFSIQDEPIILMQFDEIIGTEPKISKSKCSKIIKSLADYITNPQYYLSPTLNIPILSAIIGIKSENTVYAFKKKFNCTFFDYINKKRLDYAISILKKQPESNIDDVITQSGFLTKKTFVNTLKKNYNKTLSQLLEEIDNSI